MGIDAFTAMCDRALTAYGMNPVVHSLLIDGVFAGVGSVLSFLPIIVVLFSSCLFWKIPVIWRELHLSWINR